MKLLPPLIVLFLLAGCITPTTPRRTAVVSPMTIQVRTDGRVQSVALEDYVLGSVLSEVSPIGEAPEAVVRILEVQAILARTYAIAHLGKHRQDGFDVCDGTHCQLYEPGRVATSRFAEVAREAVGRTRGAVMLFSERPAEGLYHSDCGGHTAAADRVWGGPPVAYLAGAKDDLPTPTHRLWTFAASRARLGAALKLDARSDVGRRLDRIAVTERDASGRAAKIEIRGSRTLELKGEDLRSILNQTFGDRAIMSTKFSIARGGTEIRFSGTGFGHGVGLCQVGAAARARRGESVDLILATYFPGTRLATVSSSRTARNLVGRNAPSLLESP